MPATEWVVATARPLDDARDPIMGVVHARDPAAAPALAPPTTKRGRYQSGEIREAGPGSHVGLALCGLPLMADELWCSARGVLQHAVNHNKYGVCSCVALCGMCSYLAARPTVEAAWEGS